MVDRTSWIPLTTTVEEFQRSNPELAFVFVETKKDGKDYIAYTSTNYEDVEHYYSTVIIPNKKEFSLTSQSQSLNELMERMEKYGPAIIGTFI